MRFAVRVLTCLGAGAISVALADPSTPAPAATAPPPAASAPTAPAASPGAQATAASPAAPAAAAPASPAVDPEEKRLIAMGYKPRMHNGEKVFCRREEELGTRLSKGRETCGTAAELRAARTATREETERQQRVQGMPTGK